MKSKIALEFEDAARMADACRAEAVRLGLNVSIAIVDDGNYTLRVERMNGTGVATPDVALAKARTSVLMRGPTRLLADRVRTEVELLRLTDYLPMQGGLPLMIDGQCAGAIGVSGATPEQDEQIAQAGIAAAMAFAT